MAGKIALRKRGKGAARLARAMLKDADSEAFASTHEACDRAIGTLARAATKFGRAQQILDEMDPVAREVSNTIAEATTKLEARCGRRK